MKWSLCKYSSNSYIKEQPNTLKYQVYNTIWLCVNIKNASNFSDAVRWEFDSKMSSWKNDNYYYKYVVFREGNLVD